MTRRAVTQKTVEKPFCRVCLSTVDQLKEESISLYNEVVCNCKGTTGAICHKCIERLIIVYKENYCLHCMKYYRNIQIIYSCHYVEALSLCVAPIIRVYIGLRFGLLALIAALNNVKTTYMISMMLEHLIMQKKMQSEVIAIRVFDGKGFWGSVWAKIGYKLGF